MNRAAAARLLALSAAFDSRTIGETDVEAWTLALDGLDVDRCKTAIVKHYRESTDRVMPAHIRRLARTTTGDPGVIPETGEAFCGDCKGVHRPRESCAVLARPEGFKAAIAGAFRSVADALSPRAIEAQPNAQEPAVPQKSPLNAVEQRCARQATTPVGGVLPAACAKCGATYLDYPDGRDAHLAVFGHKPPDPTTDAREAS